MTSLPAARTFEVRHVQIARAAFAALAAAMITFSPDHSAEVGLAVFSGFALASGLVLLLAAWLVSPAGRRWPAIALGLLSIVAGMAGGLAPLRTTVGFFAIVAAWAIASGLVEAITGWHGVRRPTSRREIAPGVADARPLAVRAPGPESRDAMVIGVLSVLLGLALLLVPTGYALQYRIDGIEAPFTLTGIIIGVGIFGAYAAIVAVYLAIAGFSPRKPVVAAGAAASSEAATPVAATHESSTA